MSHLGLCLVIFLCSYVSVVVFDVNGEGKGEKKAQEREKERSRKERIKKREKD